MTEKEYEYACSLINPKYQFPTKVQSDVFEYLTNNSSRMIQLSTIAKLTTDNRAFIEDFPIDFDMHGLEPYNEYVIKVNDTYETSLYIFVHYRGNKTYLFPVLIGFDATYPSSPLNLTDNWRARSIRENNYINVCRSDEEFGLEGLMIVVDNHDIYGKLLVLSNINKNLLKEWQYSEEKSLMSGITTTLSSLSLIIQIWLHTICLWRKRSVNRNIKIVHSNGQIENIQDIKNFSSQKQTIIDLNKDIRVYVNDTLTKREFRGYHMRESQRCGHFRHLNNGKIIYIPPTTVHYKKLVPDELLVGTKCKPLIYRNTEDFLREKSYLEYDVLLMLKSKGIKFEREKTFDWLKRKRLDFYLPDKNIAIECQGVQHFYRYGSNDSDLESRKQRDIDKYNECTKNNILLIYYLSPDIPVPKEMSDKYLYITDLTDLYNLIK